MTKNDAGVSKSAEAALENIREYFSDRSDASMEPGDTQFHGNQEMGLLAEVMIVEDELARLGKRLSDGTRDAERYRRWTCAEGHEWLLPENVTWSECGQCDARTARGNPITLRGAA